jgi:methionyl-tRNA formyltransferase
VTARPSPDRGSDHGRDSGDRAAAIFFGSGGFAVPILEAVAQSPHLRLTAVLSAPDHPAGRGGRPRPSPVAIRARELGVRLLQPVRIRDPEVVTEVAALDPRIGLLADYGQIIPAAIIDAFPAGILNVHPSLLPRHRGATPIPAAILAGDAEAGVTIIRMDEGLDTGPIVAASAWPLDRSETTPDLERRAADEGARLLAAVVRPWIDGSIEAREQPAAGATLTRTLRRADGRLDPHRSAVELERQVRAYQPWPGTWFESNAGRVVVWSVGVVGERSTSGPPGTLTASGVVVADGVLLLGEVQLAGGTRMDWASALRGRRDLEGSRIAE